MKTTIFKYMYKIIVFLLFLNNGSYSQNTFLKTYGGVGSNRGYSLLQTSDSGYVIFGYMDGFKTSLIKTNKLGDTVWIKTYSTDKYYDWYSVKITPDGGYLLGYGSSLIKTDSVGEVVWQKSYDKTTIYSIAISENDDYVFTGYIYDSTFILFLMKVNRNGDNLWLKTYQTTAGSSLRGKCVKATSDSGYIISGNLFVSTTNGDDLFAIKTDKNGDTLWTITYGGKYVDSGSNITETKDGNYFIVGDYTVQPCENCDLLLHSWLLKLDQHGDTLWTKKIYLGVWELFSTGIPTKDGGYIITGTVDVPDIFNPYLFVLKLNENGDTLWTKIFVDKGISSSEGLDIIETYDGGYAVIGSITYLNEQKDMLLLKLDKDGNITAIEDKKDNTTPTAFSLQQSYPNPFNPITTIRYSIPKTIIVKIQVYDILGREVVTLVNEEKLSGNYEVKFNAAELASGVYFYQIKAGDFIETKKLILLR